MINFGMEADDTSACYQSKSKKRHGGSVNLITNVIEEGIGTGEFHRRLERQRIRIKFFTLMEGCYNDCTGYGQQHSTTHCYKNAES
jgi:hypothetical protein